ncbi:hypothetical protein A6M21_15335 [Desulfotomaculum copahuensis]|uniref:HTH tetR-type domain-containing protein n=2 Tax=Desulfotomaculum copahuensis TaxID=1838280 RepID=A0A1B7LBH8_9FIRM|nr:hypothetical protein A6M21_15335 [Desulfotomaculum copahuensis]
MAVARKIFAARGFDAARVEEITGAAGVNKRMLYHYFGSKEGLYLEVLKECFERVYRMSSEELCVEGAVVERARAAVSRYFYFLAENLDFVRLVGWETLQGGRFAGQVLSGLFEAGLEKLESILDQGVREGVFRPDIDIRRLLVSINGLCLSYFSRLDMLRFLWPRDPRAPEMLAAHLEHILALVWRGILAPEK